MRVGRYRWTPRETPDDIWWHKEVSVTYTLQPTRDQRWRWSAEYRFDGLLNPVTYQFGYRHHDRPYQVHGVCRQRSKAHVEMMRAVHAMAKLARAANAHAAHKAAATMRDTVRT